jgi:RNA polymerase sigma factor (sigma-70 family)
MPAKQKLRFLLLNYPPTGQTRPLPGTENEQWTLQLKLFCAIVVAGGCYWPEPPLPMTPDSALLRQYAEQGDEAAFAEVVRRHVKFVYASAVRLLNGDLALAQDVSQMVFNDLARKASQMGKYDTVAGWLHTSVRFAALSAIRTEQRRRNREHEASAMSDSTMTQELSWTQLRPLIDEALSQLPTAERDIVLLRFFEEKSHREIGEALGLNENTARMRVERAVEKLRAFFARHGVKTTAALLTTTLSAQPITPVPAGFATAVAGKSLAGAAGAASGQSAGLFATKTKAILVSTAILATAAASTIIFYRPAQNPAPAPKSPIVAATPAPAATKLSTLPNPTMNTSQLLSAGTLAAALLTATPVVAQAATSADPVVNNLQQAADAFTPQNPTSPANQDAPAPTQSPTTDSSTSTPDTQPQPATVTGLATWKSGHSPVLVDTTGVLKDKTITAIASSGGSTPHWLVLCSDNTLASWGDNREGQLGIGKTGASSSSMVPVLVDSTHELQGETITAIAAYGNYSMALASDGKAYVWGCDDKGGGQPQLTYPGTAKNWFHNSFSKSSALLVIGFSAKGAMTIAAGSSPVFLCPDGSLYMWGYWSNGNHLVPTWSANGHTRQFWLDGSPEGPNGPIEEANSAFYYPIIQLGKTMSTPVPFNYGVLKDKTIIALAGGEFHDLALCSDGTLAFWGHLHNLHPLAPQYSQDPIALNTGDVFKGKTITAIGDGGGNRLMALCSDGTLAIWQEKPLDSTLPEDSPFWKIGERVPDHSRNYYVAGNPSYTGGKADPSRARFYSVAPVVVNTTEGVLKGKTIKAIGGSMDSMVMLCSDGTLTQWDLNGKLEAVDTSGVLKGKKILAIAPGLVLFSEPAGQTPSTDDSTDPASPGGSPTPAVTFKPFSL